MALKLSDLQGQYEEVTPETKKQGGGVMSLLNRAGQFAGGINTGIYKAVGETALGIGQIGRGAQRAVAGLFGTTPTGGESIFDPNRAQQIRETTLAANKPGEGTGKFIGTTAQYLIPTSPIAKGQQILGAAARGVPTGVGRGIAGAAARFIPEAAGTGAVAFTRSGGDVEQTKDEALLAGGFSVGLGALGSVARSTYWPTLDDAVSKAFGTQGKKSGGVALQETAKKVSALQVLKERAPELKVTLDDGSKVAFDPSSATYKTTLEAWDDARKKIFKEYTSVASQAGTKATVDLSSVREQIAAAVDAPIVGTELNAVKSLLTDFDRVFKDPSNVDMETAQRFVQSLNENTVQGFFAGTSDAASSKVNAGTSRLIREALDDTIEETTGAQYQTLRSQYAALKAIENDLVRKFQQDARQIGGGIPEYMGGFASADLVESLLTADVAKFSKGATLGAFAALKRKLSNPERFLRRAFDLTDDTPSDLYLRVFGGSRALSPEEQAAAGAVTEAVKNPNIGLSIKNTATQAQISDFIAQQTKKLENMRGEGMSVNNPAYKKIEESINQANRQLSGSFNTGATPQTTALLEEAKKYKSAEEFVKAQGTPLYHGTDYFSYKNIENEGFRLNTTENGVKPRNGNYLGDGIYLTSSQSGAANFAKSSGSFAGGVLETYIPSSIKLYEINIESVAKLKENVPDNMSITDYIKSKGFDGLNVDYGNGKNEVVIYDPSLIKTRTQLENLWEKANKNTP